MTSKKIFTRIDIARDNIHYAVGSLSNCDCGMGLAYRPSQKSLLRIDDYDSQNGFHLRNNNVSKFDHITLHKDGKIGVKCKPEKVDFLITNNIWIKDTGHRHLLRDFVENIELLPDKLPEENSVGKTVCFDIPSNIERVFLLFDILSGRNVINGNLDFIPKKDSEAELITSKLIKFSNNPLLSDKALSISLFHHYGDKMEILSGRGIFVTNEEPIIVG